jgi:hypothetical protein
MVDPRPDARAARSKAATSGARARKLHQLRIRRAGDGWESTCSCGWSVQAPSRIDAADAHHDHLGEALRPPRSARHELVEFRRGRAQAMVWRVACRCGWSRTDLPGRQAAEDAWRAHRGGVGPTGGPASGPASAG